MKYALLGETGVFVSRLCLGCMTFGGRDVPRYQDIGGLDLKETQAIVDAALDAGINFFDTANVYARGESETLIGQAIQGRRDRIVLASKFHARVGAGPNDVGQSRVHMMQALEDSLRRLNTDHIDLYQLHGFDPHTRFDDVLRTLDDAIRQGKVRYIGCSNMAAWQIMKALGIAERRNLERFVSVQAYYSLAGRDLEHDLLPMIEDQKLSLMVWSPLAGGFLSGRYDRHSEEGASRRDKLSFPPIHREQALDIVDVLKTIAHRHGVSGAQVALAWLLAKPAVSSIVIGARRVDQLNDNVAALALELTSQDLAELDAISDTGPHYPGWIMQYSAGMRMPGA